MDTARHAWQRRAVDGARFVIRRGDANLRLADGRFSRNLAVFVYHRVASPRSDPWNLAVSPEHFDGQLGALGSSGRLVRLGDEVTRSRVTRIGRRDPRFAITFDDGYADNLHAALPALERHGFPATIFVATGFLDRPHFWWDRLTALVFASSASTSQLAAAAEDVGLRQGAEPSDPHLLHAGLHNHLAWRGLSEIEEMLDRLSFGVVEIDDLDGARPLSSAELVELADHPLVSIGAHTSTHPRLTRLDRASAMEEITRGNQRLDELLGPVPRSLAYPYGDAGRSTARTARAAGFDHAVTTQPRWVGCFDNRRLLPRLHPLDVDGAKFAQQLARA